MKSPVAPYGQNMKKKKKRKKKGKKAHLRTHEAIKKKLQKQRFSIFTNVLEISGSKNGFNIYPLPRIALAQTLKIRCVLEARKGKQSCVI